MLTTMLSPGTLTADEISRSDTLRLRIGVMACHFWRMILNISWLQRPHWASFTRCPNRYHPLHTAAAFMTYFCRRCPYKSSEISEQGSVEGPLYWPSPAAGCSADNGMLPTGWTRGIFAMVGKLRLNCLLLYIWRFWIWAIPGISFRKEVPPHQEQEEWFLAF